MRTSGTEAQAQVEVDSVIGGLVHPQPTPLGR